MEKVQDNFSSKIHTHTDLICTLLFQGKKEEALQSLSAYCELLTSAMQYGVGNRLLTGEDVVRINCKLEGLFLSIKNQDFVSFVDILRFEIKNEIVF